MHLFLFNGFILGPNNRKRHLALGASVELSIRLPLPVVIQSNTALLNF